jgi:hypothetical protein
MPRKFAKIHVSGQKKREPGTSRHSCERKDKRDSELFIESILWFIPYL